MHTCVPARADVIGMLAAAGLPTADIVAGQDIRFVGLHDGGLVAVGGIERYGDVALLRSLVTAEARRGAGIGTALCAALESEARRSGVRELFLLTETAAPFFAARGFEPMSRAAAPPAIAATRQFSSLCPTDAIFMRKRLTLQQPEDRKRTTQ